MNASTLLERRVIEKEVARVVHDVRDTMQGYWSDSHVVETVIELLDARGLRVVRASAQ